MRKILARAIAGLLLVASAASAVGCYNDYYAARYCAAVWVPGHYSQWGQWHPGHWRCT
jgi:hypothetical protein